MKDNFFSFLFFDLLAHLLCFCDKVFVGHSCVRQYELMYFWFNKNTHIPLSPCCLNTGFWLWEHIRIYDVKTAAFRESQSLFCMNVESITITGSHNWHVRSLTKAHIIIVAWRTTESNNTWYPGDSKMNSSNEIGDKSVDIWGAVREVRWMKRKGLHSVEQRNYLQIYHLWDFLLFNIVMIIMKAWWWWCRWWHFLQLFNFGELEK